MLLIIVFSNSRICIYMCCLRTNQQEHPTTLQRGMDAKTLQADACMPMPKIKILLAYILRFNSK